MDDQRIDRDRALDQLTSEFPNVSARIVVRMYVGYLERVVSVPAAVAATRDRLRDACAAA